MHRVVAAVDGLPADAVFAVDVDARGRVWVGGPSGIAQLDGSGIRVMYPDEIGVRIESLAVCGDTVWAVGSGQGVWEVTAEHARPLVDASGARLRGSFDVSCDGDDRIVVIDQGRILRGDATALTEVGPPELLAEGVRAVRTFGDRLLVGTARGVWEEQGGAWTRLYDAASVVDLWADGDRVASLDRGARVQIYDRSGPVAALKTALTLHSRGIALVGRKGTLWVGTDRELVGIGADGSVSVTGEDRIVSGGALAVGREGELLLGTFGGLHIFPEPDTRTFDLGDGLPNQHGRFLTPTPDGLWVTTWQGSVIVRDLPEQADGVLELMGVPDPVERARRMAAVDVRIEPVGGAIIRVRPCVDGRGQVWAGGAVEIDQHYVGAALGRYDGHGLRLQPLDAGDWVWACTVDRHGDVWFFTGASMIRAAEPMEVHRGLGVDNDVVAAELGPDGAMYFVAGYELCRIALAARGEVGERTCAQHAPGVAYDVTWMPDGTMLLATATDGLLESLDGEHFHRVLGVDGRPVLNGKEIMELSRSPRGGVWAAGPADRERIERMNGSWAVVEHVEAWHGLPGTGATSIRELDNGEVWATSWRGAVRVPASSREEIPPLPVPFLSAMEVDGRAVAPDEFAEGHRWRITLGAPGFRDPDRRRFRAWLDGSVSAPSASPVFDLYGMSPGTHELVLEVSSDGERWAALPVPIALNVPAAWYQRWELYAALAALWAVTSWALYRVRVRRAVELERQRLRIAMDLHDELGSGLGSVGILAGLAADEGVEPASARAAAGDIADIAGALGDALSDIVWSLRPESVTTRALVARLREQARRLVPGPRPALEMDLNTPDLRLDPAVCRAVHRIAVEAIYNAVRHARGSVITLRLTGGARGMTLVVADDGVGLRGADESSGGLGLRSMRRRAEDVGAALQIGGGERCGTVVTLRFTPSVRGGSP